MARSGCTITGVAADILLVYQVIVCLLDNKGQQCEVLFGKLEMQLTNRFNDMCSTVIFVTDVLTSILHRLTSAFCLF